MDVKQGDETFRRDQIVNLWSEASLADPFLFTTADLRNQSHRLHCRNFRFDANGELLSAEERHQRLENLVAQLLEAAAAPDEHFRSMDEIFSPSLVIRVGNQADSEHTAHSHSIDECIMVLERLPSVPPQLDLSHRHAWHVDMQDMLSRYSRYFNGINPGDSSSAPTSSPWKQLQVVTKFSTATLRLAVLLVVSRDAEYNVASCIWSFLDLVTELLDIMCMPYKNTTDLEYPLKEDIVKIYLWATWTRCSLLFFWFVLATQLKYGYDQQWQQLLALRGTGILKEPAIRATLYGWKNERVPYMCSWAFKLLKSDRAALSLDFRHFHRRFAELHSKKQQRCLWESDDACDGGHPLRCGRFQDKRLVAGEQSVHACGLHQQHSACGRVIWDRDSYVAIRGPVAVSASPATITVTFTRASASTMAISHVWSQGHGGRPHTGLNKCLHDRFSHLARRMGCDSYWIDTLCIPDEQKLRKQAISYINWIFAESKVVLVLDRDLMDIDVSNLTVELLEALVATFLVCDWNVRAWTMLEAMKGSHNLQLLCKNEETISLRQCFMTMHQKGRLDLAALVLACQHLMPSSTDAFRNSSSRKTLEVAGSLLSHRHATRPGDDIVIWSLISNTKVYYSAAEMWKGLVGRRIKTAFLMSNSPRLSNVAGLSRAPETPYIRQQPFGTRNPLNHFLVYEGADSEAALITPKGLEGDWQVYRVNRTQDELYKDTPVTFSIVSSTGHHEEKVIAGQRIINLCWRTAVGLLADHVEVVLIQPVAMVSGGINYQLSSGRGESHGEVFAICVSDDGERWCWKGVESWPRMALPPTERDTLLIS